MEIAKLKIQIPNFKHQSPDKFQYPITKTFGNCLSGETGNLIIGYYLEFGIWSLEFKLPPYRRKFIGLTFS